jgi:hypothetical protein
MRTHLEETLDDLERRALNGQAPVVVKCISVISSDYD